MNAVTNNTIELSKSSEAKAGGEVATAKIRTENNQRQKWTVKACKDSKKAAAQVEKVAKVQVEEKQEPLQRGTLKQTKLDEEGDGEILDSLVKRFDEQLTKNTAKVAAIEKK